MSDEGRMGAHERGDGGGVVRAEPPSSVRRTLGVMLAAVALLAAVWSIEAAAKPPKRAPTPAPSPRGLDADFDAAKAWMARPRRIEARPRPNPRRALGSSVSSFTARTIASSRPTQTQTQTSLRQSAIGNANWFANKLRQANQSSEQTVAALRQPAVPATPASAAAATAEHAGGATLTKVQVSQGQPRRAPKALDAALRKTVPKPNGADNPLPIKPMSGEVGFMVVRLRDHAPMAHRKTEQGFIPASVAKAPTALYAIDALGLDYRFKTRVLAKGSIDGGVLKGDLYLVGGGDPTLDTADLKRLAKALKDAGVNRVSGGFYYDARALPSVAAIEPSQPIYAAYNPGVSGLGVNFNRVLLKWRRLKNKSYELEMLAHSAGAQISASGFRAALLDKSDRALFRRDRAARRIKGGRRNVERWRVAPRSLGRRGQRWLPVRGASLYAAETFRDLAGKAGVRMGLPREGAAPRMSAPGVRLIGAESSVKLSVILRGMLKHSTNLTAEAVGLTSSGVKRLAASPLQTSTPDPSRSLERSGDAMAEWVNTRFGLTGGAAPTPVKFSNHSGLSIESRTSPRAMTQILANAAADPESFQAFYKLMPPRTPRALRKIATVRAKTGTIYYGRALAGYIECSKSKELFAFAYFNSDPVVRKSFDEKLDVNAAGPPREASRWLSRAVTIERRLVSNWGKKLCP